MTGGGHSTDFGALGGFAAHGGDGRSGSPQGETIDVALGKNLGGIFPQIGLGIADRPQLTTIYNCSAWDKGKPLPTQCRPDLVYATLFGSAADGAAREEFLARSNVLDFSPDDVKRLEREVGTAEHEKLARHLEAYESLRDATADSTKSRARFANMPPSSRINTGRTWKPIGSTHTSTLPPPR